MLLHLIAALALAQGADAPRSFFPTPGRFVPAPAPAPPAPAADNPTRQFLRETMAEARAADAPPAPCTCRCVAFYRDKGVCPCTPENHCNDPDCVPAAHAKAASPPFVPPYVPAPRTEPPPPPAAPTTYSLADASGQVWTHADPAWLSEWVRRRNATLAAPAYTAPVAQPYAALPPAGYPSWYGAPAAGFHPFRRFSQCGPGGCR